MPRLLVFALFLPCLVVPSTALSDPSFKEVDLNGVRLPYVEQGSGDTIVFVHGALSGPAAWEPVRELIAGKLRFIAYTQRYYGTQPWPDDGKRFSVANHADDLTAFIKSLKVGPVHVVGWSYGGLVAATGALKDPSLVRSLILYEASVLSVLPAEGPEAKAAREDRAQMFGPAAVAARAGDPVQASRLMYEAVYQLPPGGFERLPSAVRTRVLDNARTMPLLFAAPPPAPITCDMLRAFGRPTLVVRGAKTRTFYALTSDAIASCVPGARRVVLENVGHDGPGRDPAAFTVAVLDFLSRR